MPSRSAKSDASLADSLTGKAPGVRKGTWGIAASHRRWLRALGAIIFSRPGDGRRHYPLMIEDVETEGTVRVSMNHTSHTQASPDAWNPAGLTFASAPDLPNPAAGDDAADPLNLDRGTDNGAIEFRVLRPGAPVRRLRLTGNRYTFGSAEGCSIRLGDQTLRPMHAVLIRDVQQILIRAYSEPVEVNGTSTSETVLKVGDILRMGSYRFELLSTSSQSAPTNLPSALASPPASALSSQPTPADKEGSELPATEEVVWRERLRREVEQWRTRQAECDRRESRCDHREENLRGRESELWARAEHLYRREAQLQSQEAAAIQIHEEYAQKQQELIQLREESYAQKRVYERRENEIRTLETQFHQQENAYRKQIEEATRQLQQSQQQAQAASDAVQRMREQFVSLNEQIDELSTQQEQLQLEESQQREEHQRIRHELEEARDQAIDSQAESDALRHQAEARVEQLSAELEALRSNQGDEIQSHQQRIEQSEEIANQLRQQVEQLQQSVTEAREESGRLQSDYEEACQTVRDLQHLISQGEEKGNVDRESWAEEAEQLRQTVEQLSVDLARSNGELSELREANDSLNSRLEEIQVQHEEMRAQRDEIATARDEVTAQRDEFAAQRDEFAAQRDQLSLQRDQLSAQCEQITAQCDELRDKCDELSQQSEQLRSERDQISADRDELSAQQDEMRQLADSRPSDEAWQSLREELDCANRQLAEMKREYDATLARLEELDVAEQTEHESASHDSPPSTAQQDSDGRADDFAGEVQSELSADEDANEAWPSYDSNDSQAQQSDSEPLIEPEASPAVEAWDEPSLSNEEPKSLVNEPVEFADLETDQTDQSAMEVDGADPADVLSDPQVEQADSELDSPTWSVDESELLPSSESNQDAASLADAQEDDSTAVAESDEHTIAWNSDDQSSDTDELTDSVLPENPWGESSSVWESNAGDDDQSPDTEDLNNSVLPENPWGESSSVWESTDNRDDEPSDAGESAEQASYWPSAAETDESGAVETPNDIETSQQSGAESSENLWAESSSVWQSEPSEAPQPAEEAEDSSWSVAESSESESAAWGDAPSDASSAYDLPEAGDSWSNTSDDNHLQESEDAGSNVDLQQDDPTDVTSPWTAAEELEAEAENPWSSAYSSEDDESDDVSQTQLLDDHSDTSEQESFHAGSSEADSQPPATDYEDEDVVDGSLASMLIQDLSADAEDPQEEEGTYLMDESVGNSWDQEHPEEALASSWTNEEDGYRTESIEEGDQLGEESISEFGGSTEQSETSFGAEEEDVADNEPQDEPVAVEQEPQPGTGSEPDDDSIEAYMNRLLQRVQGEPDDGSKPETVALTASTSSLDMAESRLLAPEGEPLESGESQPPADPNAPLVPRSEAPEKHSNLSAMRELANQSARSAINRSARVQSRDTQVKGILKFFFAAVALVCGVACFIFIPGAVRFLAVAMTIVVAGICIHEGWQLFGEAKRRLIASENEETDFEVDGPMEDPRDEPKSAESEVE